MHSMFRTLYTIPSYAPDYQGTERGGVTHSLLSLAVPNVR